MSTALGDRGSAPVSSSAGHAECTCVTPRQEPLTRRSDRSVGKPMSIRASSRRPRVHKPFLRIPCWPLHPDCCPTRSPICARGQVGLLDATKVHQGFSSTSRIHFPNPALGGALHHPDLWPRSADRAPRASAPAAIAIPPLPALCWEP